MPNNELEIKDFLQQARNLDAKIDNKIALLESLNCLATKATQTFSDMPHSPNRNNSSLENTIIKIIDLQNEINADIDRLVDLKQLITSTIEELPNTTAQIIFMKRYLKYMTWEQIADSLSFSVKHVQRLHKSYLCKIKIPSNFRKTE